MKAQKENMHADLVNEGLAVCLERFDMLFMELVRA